MAQPYLSQIMMFGGNFAPKNWALCNGQLLAINQYAALFSLLGTMYGGDGTTTFALPNLQSMLPVHVGQGPGLSNYVQGQTSGSPTVTLNQNTTPPHSHFLMASTANATSATIANNLPGTPTVAGAEFYAANGAPPLPPLVPEALASATCSTMGGNQPHTNLMPSLCISFCIALVGVYPTRN
jgi:microcystin-dependent protein